LIFLYDSKNVFQNSQVIKKSQLKINTDPFLAKKNIHVSFLGSGQYATSFLMPLFQKSGVILNSVSSESGLSAASAFKKYKFIQSYSNNKDVISEDGVDAIIISTRHDSHASLVVDSIKANKHVFVEKPLCTDDLALKEITDCVLSEENKKILMVGFNRRFSPHIIKINSLLSNISSAKSFVMNINAGSLDESHWLNDPKKGGGRLIGEACHFIDLLRHLSGYPISQSSVISSSNYNDSLIINLKFVDGSIGVINYFVNGHKSLPKERLEIFVDNKTLFLENYQKLSGAGWKNFKKFKTWSQDKGQKNCISAFVNAIRNSESSPIPYDELVEVAQVSIDLSKQLS
jgi:predicted dehydrogenase